MLAGAGYLFFVNCYFIFMSAAVILTILSTPKVRELTEKQWKRLRAKMIRNTMIVILPSIVLTYFMLTE